MSPLPFVEDRLDTKVREFNPPCAGGQCHDLPGTQITWHAITS
jgi:hypothetical protein